MSYRECRRTYSEGSPSSSSAGVINSFIKEEFSKFTIRDLKTYAQTYNNQNSELGDLAKEVIMDILFQKMTTEEYLQFCNEI